MTDSEAFEYSRSLSSSLALTDLNGQASIYNIGTDIAYIPRFEKIFNQHAQRFCHKILSTNEQRDFHNSSHPVNFLAKRWATKEALTKALGTGISSSIQLKECETQHDALGKPVLHTYGKLAAYLESLNITQCFLSVADDQDYAIAFVILAH